MTLNAQVGTPPPADIAPANLPNAIFNAEHAWYRGGNNPGGDGGFNNIFGTMWNSPIFTYTNGVNRLTVNSGGSGINAGFVAMGNNLLGFVPQDRLHLHHDISSAVKMRFTHGALGSSSSDGTDLGIQGTGDFRLTQFENQNIDFFTPRNDLSSAPEVRRFSIMPNGQTLIGNNSTTENIISGAAIVGFSNAPSSLLNVRGPINSCADLNTNPTPTILYGYTTPTGNPSNATGLDGFRMLMNRDFGSPNSDALVFDKTDWNGNDPDGKIAFTNTGADGVQEISAYFTGQGRAFFGKTLLSNSQVFNRVNIESQSSDASPSGLRLVNLPNTSASIPNPTNKVLSVNASGDVILVNDAGGGGQNGSNALVNTVIEAAGINCATGGLYVTSGIDLNGNNILDLAEITSSGYVCNGLTGPAGPTGPMGPAGSVNGAYNGCSLDPTDPSLVVLGHSINGSGAELINSRIIPMNGNNIYFTNNGVNNSLNRIGIGTGTSASAKLHINVDPLDNSSTSLAVHNASEFGGSVGLNMKVNGNNTGINYGERTTVENGDTRNINKDLISTGGNFAEGISIQANNGTTSNIGLIITSANNNGTNSSAENVGVSSVAGDGLNNYAGFFVTKAASVTAGENEAVRGYALGVGSANYGVRAHADQGVTNNYGVRASTTGSAANNFGIRASACCFTGNNWAGFFDGNVQVTGTVSASNGSPLTSDQMFKTDVNDLTNALDILAQIQPKTYFYDTLNFSDFGFEKDQQMGVIAQEIEHVLPAIVSSHIRPADYDSLGNVIKPELAYKSVEYTELIPLLVSGVNEQQKQIEEKDSLITDLRTELSDVNARLAQLENCLSALLPTLCSMNQEAVQRNSIEEQKKLEENLKQKMALDIRLSDKNAVILSQNVPNPFAEMTTIKYMIPETVKEAQIHFYTAKGIIINSVVIIERGNGEIRVFAEDLSSGIYTYSLVADGKVVATMKMMKQ